MVAMAIVYHATQLREASIILVGHGYSILSNAHQIITVYEEMLYASCGVEMVSDHVILIGSHDLNT